MLEKVSEENILKVDFSDEFKKSYIDYSMSVITSRAIPDARDGLKPVQRRVLFDMSKLNLNYNGPTKKCARIVGDTMGKYHPHGDSSIYESLVVMSQDFKKSIPLIYGQGNLGTIEGDGAAAQRYTEAKLNKFSQDILLTDLKDSITYVKNYDGTEVEPEVLPARLPMILINGSEGIAVGMTTSTPPHNIGEVCDLCIAYLNNPESDIELLMKYLPGPDFPTGGIISNKKDLISIYETGVGKIRIRGKLDIEKAKNKRDRDKIIITEIPYTMIGSGIEKFLYDVASLVEEKKLLDVVDIANQSNKEGIRIVIEFKAGSDLEYAKNVILKKTKLEDTFGVNMLSIHGGRPEVLNLKEILKIWYDFQVEITQKKYRAVLNDSLVKEEICLGLLDACEDIDLIIDVIRGAKMASDAMECLTTGCTSLITFKKKTQETKAKKLHFTKLQAEAILKMQLQKLIGLELETLREEENSLKDTIKHCKRILSDETEIVNLLKRNLIHYKKDFGKNRKTSLEDSKEITYVERVEVIDGYFIMDKFRYCKFIDQPTFDRNKEMIYEHFITCIPVRSNQRLLFFINTGYLHQLKCDSIPLRKIKEKGEPLENLISLTSSEEILYIQSDDQLQDLFFLTERGYVKSVISEEFNVTKKISLATKLNDGDKLVSVIPKYENDRLILCTENGYILKIILSENKIPSSKKNSIGIKAIAISDKDKVKEGFLLTSGGSFTFNDKQLNESDIKSDKRGRSGTKFF